MAYYTLYGTEKITQPSQQQNYRLLTDAKNKFNRQATLTHTKHTDFLVNNPMPPAGNSTPKHSRSYLLILFCQHSTPGRHLLKGKIQNVAITLGPHIISRAAL